MTAENGFFVVVSITTLKIYWAKTGIIFEEPLFLNLVHFYVVYDSIVYVFFFE